ncbi:MAG: ATP-binding protein [Acidimicrobiaceae bacterium]|nr:ATP-binding protein [Acidimicrobiaceae bacterium]MCY4280853.1 ATP-binding protein [Acidimicrobiaceae bacterium]
MSRLRLRLRPPVLRRGLRTRLTLAFAVGGLVLASIISFTTLTLTRQNLLEERDEAASSVFANNGRRVRNELTAETDDEGRRAIVERLRQTSNTFPLLRVGDAWTSADPLVFNQQTVPPPLLGLVESGSPARMRAGVGNSVAIVSGVPLPGAPTDVSYFEAALLDDVEDTLDTLAFILFGVAAVTAMFAAAVGWWAAGRLLHPLVNVRTAAEALAAGELDTRLETPADEDLASLAASFNEMARALSERIARDARFASEVSHELRSPLMTLTASVEVLYNMADELTERGRTALDLLSDDISRFSRLVEDLLEINRYDVGIADLEAEEVQIVEFVQHAISQFRLDSTAEIDFRAAAGTEGTMLPADKRRLGRVVSNLLDNASKYGDGEVRVRLEGLAGLVRLRVEDNGPGVTPAERKLIFDRFHRGRAGGRRGRDSGSGLGLALVAEHVALHGGRVWVEDRTGSTRGARFVVELPVSQPLDASTAPGTPGASGASDKRGASGEPGVSGASEASELQEASEASGASESGGRRGSRGLLSRAGLVGRIGRTRLLALAVLLAVVVSGCGIPIDENAQVIDSEELPESLRPGFTASTTTTVAAAPQTETRSVFLLTNPQDIERTVVVEVQRQVERGAPLADLLATLFGEPASAEESDAGYFNTLELFEILSATVSNGIATVDMVLLSPEGEQQPPSTDELRFAAAQLVFTASEVVYIDGVRILLDGAEVSVPTSDADAEPGSVLRTGAYEQFLLSFAP